MLIRINAFDTLFFRDGRPFSMGEDSWASGIFPPAPSVLYGVLRSAFLAQAGFSDENIAASANLKIKKIVLEGELLSNGTQEKLFLPPTDLMELEGGRFKKYSVQTAQASPSNSSYHPSLSHQLLPTLIDGEEPEVLATDGYFVIEEAFQDYLLNSTVSAGSLQAREEFMGLEAKVGIGRENMTRSTAEGQLYRVGLNRMTGSSYKLHILVEFEGLPLTKNGLLKIGGEGKTAAYESVDEAVNIPCADLSSGYFKLYLASPAIFTKGWLPSWIDKDTLEGEYQGVKLKLIAANVGSPQSIGGFDMATRRPKAMFKAVPAGSVYYFQCLEGDSSTLETNLHGQCISDLRQEEGFGLVFLGKVKMEA